MEAIWQWLSTYALEGTVALIAGTLAGLLQGVKDVRAIRGQGVENRKTLIELKNLEIEEWKKTATRLAAEKQQLLDAGDAAPLIDQLQE